MVPWCIWSLLRTCTSSERPCQVGALSLHLSISARTVSVTNRLWHIHHSMKVHLSIRFFLSISAISVYLTCSSTARATPHWDVDTGANYNKTKKHFIEFDQLLLSRIFSFDAMKWFWLEAESISIKQIFSQFSSFYRQLTLDLNMHYDIFCFSKKNLLVPKTVSLSYGF